MADDTPKATGLDAAIGTIEKVTVLLASINAPAAIIISMVATFVNGIRAMGGPKISPLVQAETIEKKLVGNKTYIGLSAARMEAKLAAAAENDGVVDDDEEN